MSNDLKIMITGSLNVGKSIGEINSAIKALEKSGRLKDLKLNITINDKVLSTLTNFNNQMKKLTISALEAKKVIEEVINPDGSRTKRTYFEGINGEFKQTETVAKKASESIKEEKKSVDELTAGFTKLNKETEKFNKKGESISSKAMYSNDNGTESRLINSNSKGEVTSYTDTIDYAKTAKLNEDLSKSVDGLIGKYKKLGDTGNLTDNELSKVSNAINGVKDTSSLEKATQVYDQMADRAKLAEQMATGREQAMIKSLNNETVAIQNQAKAQNKSNDDVNLKRQSLIQQLNKMSSESKMTESSLGRMNNAINTSKNIDQLNKLEQAMSRVNERSASNFKIGQFQEQAQLNAQNINRTHGGYVDDKALQSYLASVNSLTSRTPNLNNQMQSLNTQFKQISGNAKESAGALNQAGMSMKEMFSTAAIKFPIWMAASTAFFQTLRFFTDGVSYVNDLNKALTEISIVTGESQAGVTQLGVEYQKLAYDMGVLTDEITKASVEFYRQGLGQEDVMKNVSVASEYAKISAMDFKQAAEILTATVNSVGVDIERASDVFSYLGDATATGADEIGVAFQKVGGSVGALGIEFEKASSWIAVLSSRTREGASTIGQSIKSILARVQSLKETGFTDDGADVNQVETALKAVGIQLLDTTGNFRDFGNVMDDIGAKWGTLDSRQKAYVATTIAGTYQQSRFLNLMEGYSDTIPLYEQALNSAGTTQKKFNLYQESTEASLNRLKTTWQGIWQSGFDSETLRAAMSSLDMFGKSVKFVVDNLGLLPPVIGGALSIFLLMNGATRKAILENGLLSTSLIKTGDSMLITSGAGRVLQTSLYNLTLATRSLGNAFTVMGTMAKTSLSFLSTTLLPVAAFMALGFVISKVTDAIQNNIEKQKELKQQNDDVRDSYTKHSTEIDELVSKYEALNKQVTSGNLSETNEEYIATANRLNEIFPIITANLDEQGNAHLSNINHIKQEIEYAKQLKDNYAQINVATFEQSLDEQQKKFDEFVKKAQDAQGKLNQPFNAIWDGSSVQVSKIDLETQLELQRDVIQSEREMQLMLQNSGTYIKDKSDAFLQSSDATKNLSDESQVLLDEFVKQNIAMADTTDEGFNFTDFLNDAVNSTTDFGEALAKIPPALVGLFSVKQVQTFSPEQLSVLESINVMVKDGYTEWENYRIALENAGFKDVDGMIQHLSSSVDNTTKSVAELAKESKELIETFDNAISSISELNSIINDLNDGHGLTAKSMKSIMEKYPELIAYIDDEGKLREEIIKLIAQQDKIAKDSMIKQIEHNQSAYRKMYADNKDYFNSLVKGRENDLKNAKDLASAKLLVENELMKVLAEKWSKYYSAQSNALTAEGEKALNMSYGAAVAKGSINDKTKKYDYNDDASLFMREYAVVKANADSIKRAMDEIALSSSGIDSLSFSTEGLTKSNKELKNSIYITDAYKQALEKLNLELEKQRAIKSKYPTYSKEHQNALKNEIALMEQQKKLTEEQAKSLESQIKSGKISPVGMVTTSSKSTSSSNSKVSGNSVEANIWNFFKGKGLSDGASAGIMGNLKLESGLSTTAVNKSSGATGIAQWLGGRLAGLKTYATTLGTSWTDLNTQLEWLWKELNGAEATTKSILDKNGGLDALNNMNASSAALLFEKAFERSGGAALSQRKNNATDFYSKFSGTGVVNNSSATGTDAANIQQGIDQAKSELLGLYESIIKSNQDIEAREIELINAQLSTFENTKTQYKYTIDYENAKQEALSKTGKEYRASIDKQIVAMEGQQTANQNELNFLNALIAKGGMSANTMTDMKEKVKALKLEMLQLGNAIETTNFEKIQSRGNAFDEDRKNLQFIIDLNSSYLSTIQEGGDEYNKVAKDNIATMEKLKRSYRSQIEEHQNDLKVKKLGIKETKDLEQKIKDLTLSYWGLEGSIKSATESLVEANKKMNSEVADKLLDSYKNYLNERKDAQDRELDAEKEAVDKNHEAVMKQYEEQIQAENKAHKEKMDNIKKQFDEYQRYIQSQIEGMNRVENTRTYDKDIDALLKEKSDIQSQLNELAGDTSYEAKAKKKDLNLKLDKVNDSLFERRNARELELRKNNYDDLLETEKLKVDAIEENETKLHDDRLENLDKLKEAENDAYQARIKQIDGLKKYWNQFYTDRLNDERKFEQIRKDIVAGHFDTIEKEFEGYLDYLEKTMPELENTINGTMDAVGTSIRQNIIDNLKEALSLLNQVKSNANNNASNGGQFNSDKNATSPPSSGGSNPSGTNGTGSDSLKGRITVTKPINLWDRVRGSNEMSSKRVLQKGESFQVYGYEDGSWGRQYDVGANKWITNMPDHIKFVPDKASALAGGMTSNWNGAGEDGKGGRSMTVHPNEIINNPLDSKRLLLSAQVMDKVMSYMPQMLLPKMNNLNTSNRTDGDITIQFNVDKMTGSESDAKKFQQQIASTLRRERGMRR
ncbi:tail tape measure protein [Psychrobacillus phage Perkons]|nr:tail tape measure protein [Psychrobacillus phage Perkons]